MKPDADAQLLQTIVSALIKGQGRGGLTWMAAKLGMSVTNLRKRLQSAAGAFDAPTLRAALLVLSLKAEKATGDIVQARTINGITVEMIQSPSGLIPTWRKIP